MTGSVMITLISSESGMVLDWSIKSRDCEISDVCLQMQALNFYPLRYSNPVINFKVKKAILG